MKSNTYTIQHSTCYDFEARQLDSKLGCFTSIDPMAEKYFSISPYAYCAGDQVICINPDGKETRVAQNDNNGGISVISKDPIYFYRGMPIGTALSKTLYTSARDVGNMGAGIVAAKNGIPWTAARTAFDSYQGGREGISTQNAEFYGWNQYYSKRSNGITEAIHLKKSINHFIKSLLQ